ncbi:MAG: hypothetical protein QM534_08320 [Sediminibacterium sp.]|nr:hypothetical protein [Sediminibacterium sp.]
MNYSIPDNPILDIIISIVLIFAFLSILVSILLEWYNYKVKARSQALQDAIYNLINDKTGINYGYLFYNHFMINGLRHNRRRSVQYISSSMFADVLMDIVANQYEHSQDIAIHPQQDNQVKYHSVKNPPENIKTLGVNRGGAIPEKSQSVSNPLMVRFQEALEVMRPGPLNVLLKSFNEKAGGDYTKLKALMEHWYNDYMDRVSGWYKVKQRRKLLIAGFIIAIGLNVDSIHLIRCLSYDPALRTQMIATAVRVSDKYESLPAESREDTKALEAIVSQLEKDTTVNKREQYKTLLDRLDVSYRKQQEDMAFIQRADSVLDIMSDLNVPLGWGYDTAPLSYFNQFNPNKVTDKMAIKQLSGKRNAGLLHYLNYRNNCSTLVNWLMYLLGITITAFSLSFGAPFWFDLLVKLVNLRRAGKKPA